MNLDGIIKKLDKLNQTKQRELAEEKFSKLSEFGVLEIIIDLFEELKCKFPDLCKLETEKPEQSDPRIRAKYKKGTLKIATKSTEIYFIAEVDYGEIKIDFKGANPLGSLRLSKSHNYWVNSLKDTQEFKTKEELQDAVISFIESKI